MIGICGLAQTVENSFHGEAHQYLVEVRVLGLGNVQQSVVRIRPLRISSESNPMCHAGTPLESELEEQGASPVASKGVP